jgi:hypothetical protein
MELWTEVRRRVLTGELGKRAACLEYKLHWRTLEKILNHTEPPGYRRTKARPRPKMERFLPIIFEILEADRRAPRKQRHTAKRIFDRLVAEHEFDGCYSSVKEAVRDWKQGSKEVFLPLSHPLGEAQVDFGFAEVKLAGEQVKVALFVMTLPYSDALFIQAFSRECTESFQEGHKPMSCKELVEAMTKKKLWTSPGGATPDATLYASILRDLKKGKTGIEYLACVLILRLESGSLMEMDINKLDIDSLPSGEFFL